ncbi:MAG: D-amino acid dehydrogenase [Rhodocyclaceae bacterium]|nr:D-amino acid dehydrogenase [Rhodocyclaceae bacterium]
MVLGAGLAGVTSAWYLRQAGFEVEVVDRQPDAALETSFANGGQISVSHPEPWSNPSAPATIIKWLGRADAPLLVRPRLDPALWRWALAFARECLPTRSARNTRAIAALAIHSRDCLRALRAQLGLCYQQRTAGILHLLRDHRELQAAEQRMATLQQLGIATELLDRAGCERVEPALAADPDELAGALYAADDESGDARQFVQELVGNARDAGVRFSFDTTVSALRIDDGRAAGAWVATPDGRRRLDADAVVVCLGCHSPALVPGGARLAIYPVKGYSVTVPVVRPDRAPQVSLTEESRRIVCSRLGEQLRIAGTAELTGFDLGPNRTRSAALLAWFEHHFAGVARIADAEHWCGLRPTTPSNVPHIGAAALPGLWLNTGHGSLGWTLACGSAQCLADLMTGRQPRPDFPFHR